MSALEAYPGLSGAIVDGAGNRFLLVDLLAGERPAEPASMARELGSGLDGLLLLDRAPSGALRMVVHNADGSRPEACGNGLRCVALYAHRRGYASEDAFEIETDGGTRRAIVSPDALDRAAVSMGPAEVGAELDLPLPDGTSVRATPVQVGNPHLVLDRDPLDAAELSRLGPALARHPQFPQGTNVELVARSGVFLDALVWERGVGETAACGSGACAAAAWAVRRGVATWPVLVRFPGGTVSVFHAEAEETGLWLAGPVAICE